MNINKRISALILMAGMLAGNASAQEEESFSAFIATYVQAIKTGPDKDIALFRAAGTGNLTELRRLLDNGANVSATEAENGMQALHFAAGSGNPTAVRLLIAAGARLDVPNKNGQRPLSAAVLSGNLATVQALLDAGAALNLNPPEKYPPLAMAAKYDQREIADLLLARGTRADAMTADGKSLTQIAALEHSPDVLRRLLTAGAPVDPVDADGNTPLLLAAWAGLYDNCIVLLKAGANGSAVNKEGKTALMAAARNHSLDLSERLIAAHVPIAAADQNGWQAIHYAADAGSDNIARLLLKAGARADAQTLAGTSMLQPLHLSARGREATYSAKTRITGNDHYLELKRMLLAAGARVDAPDGGGRQAIHLAAEHGLLALTQELLTAGAKVDARSPDGDQPLHFAARNGRPLSDPNVPNQDVIINALLKAGARVDAIGAQGRQPLHDAAASGSPEGVAALIAAGADINASAQNGSRPLHLALGQRYSSDALKITKALLAAGADVNARDGRGWQALHVAASRGDNETVKYLLDAGAQATALSNDGHAPAFYAAAGKYPATEKLLLSAASGQPVVSPTERNAALIEAVKQSNLNEVKRLLALGASAEARTSSGTRAVEFATNRGNVAIVRTLVAAGARLGAVPKGGDFPDGAAPLLCGATSMFSNAVEAQTLLAAGAEPDVRCGRGWRPLESAIGGGDVAVVKSLIDAGADVNATTSEGSHPLNMAAETGKAEIVALLLAAGADTSLPDASGALPLPLALASKNPETIRLLQARSSSAQLAQAQANTGRFEHRKEIADALDQDFSPADLGYRCNSTLMDFPDRYDDLQNPANARENWSRAYSIAADFSRCVQQFSASGVPLEQRIPVYALLTPPERVRVIGNYSNGINRVRELIDQGQGMVDRELRRVSQSQDRMEGAATASRRAETERRQWVQSIGQSLQVMAERMRPPPPPDRAEFDRLVAEDKMHDNGGAPARPSAGNASRESEKDSRDRNNGKKPAETKRRKQYVMKGFNDNGVMAATSEEASKQDYEQVKKLAEKWVAERTNGTGSANAVITDIKLRECTAMGGNPLYRRCILDVTYEGDE